MPRETGASSLRRKIGRSAGWLSRRSFLHGVLGVLVWPGGSRAASNPLPPNTSQALDASGLVYISPLKSDGRESFCHGAIWFAWLDGGVVVSTGSASWRARALERGLDQARIWVGDFGPWRKPGGDFDESFRRGPSFTARGRVVDPTIHERLEQVYTRKYGEKKISRWGARARREIAAGQRVVIRYEPIPDAAPGTDRSD